jgi:hypothetical protein
MFTRQLVAGDNCLEQVAARQWGIQVVGGTGVDDQTIQRAPGMAYLLARIGRLPIGMQLPGQAQEAPPMLCRQGVQFIAFLSTGGNAMALFEQAFHQSQT